MSDGPNEEQTLAVIPDRAPEAAAPAPKPLTPQELGAWAVPPETAALLRDMDTACGSILQKIGSLEVDYMTSKLSALEELRTKRALFKNLVDEAARKAGLDIDKSRWNLDTRTMTLVRAS